MVQRLFCWNSFCWVLLQQSHQKVLRFRWDVAQGWVVVQYYWFAEDLLLEKFGIFMEERQIIWQKFEQNYAKGPTVDFVVVVLICEDFGSYGDQGATFLSWLVVGVVYGS